jgi:hypothetical protein
MGKSKELDMSEYLDFIGYDNPKYNKLSYEKKQVVLHKLWIRLKYLFYKSVEEEIEKILNHNCN